MPSRRVRSRLPGPTTRAMALEAGIPEKQLRRRDVVRLSRDTYLPAAVAGDLRARIAAVLLTAPGGAVVSHQSAAALWGIEIPLQREDRRVHLTVSTGSAVRGRSDRFVHRRVVEPEDVVRREAFHLTSRARTWRDLAGVLEEAALLAVTDQFLRQGCTMQELERGMRRQPTGRGAARARTVLPLGDGRAESPMESVLRWLVLSNDLPTPDLQLDIRSSGGRFLGRADFAWAEQKVLVEFDGDLHRERKVFVDDLRRQNRLIAEGWTVLRFSSADVLGRPDEVIAQIRAALAVAR
jgi:very-short-patch-repair endonuclease